MVEMDLQCANCCIVMQLWQLHVAEQMILDDEVNPDKYKDGKFFESTDEFDEENSVEYTKVQYKKAVLPKMVLVNISQTLSASVFYFETAVIWLWMVFFSFFTLFFF